MSDPFHNLPKGHFGAILADPPWGFKTWSGPEKKVASRGTVAPYQTMEITEMAELPIAELAAPNCCLFLWIVWPTLPEALALIEMWGFTFEELEAAGYLAVAEANWRGGYLMTAPAPICYSM